ncbi:Holliday junction branch migration protein RuvA [Synechococcus sp. CS-1325]|uniref:Holliday junction branch migration protein RuvA n=1 Tax=unclassified Synechococcus TaxID=2626047 RepID=UPI000DB4D71A|nr:MULTISPECIES: Holliday junction branch migration protein RuvA [unclassified Synechococcus]PZV00692.1 MAG: Holliday junction branch migration protein RuvA [Cyanobium sp.]MCT0200910.1 Holliday junction branch migration protein RuvA [Synechococcus sp. CS-1325]MCT0213948.1 Holliday junction branch migration protein RuvA [Synechococcus sp. CS-1326]MCT0230850.1 Holliday junction branch migration protein RuvA [Synechococcus sp. CS-1324]MCT0233524.1 Holliday junction branch migration protein RuvA [
MIGWLQGTVAEQWQQGNRCGLLLACQGVGYEVQLTRRHWDGLPPAGSSLVLYIHQAIREDSWTLFGFGARHERDLFRLLVAVSGVGPQMALALLGAMPTEELVRAIVQADLRLLAKAPGVGRRTAERLSVELRSKLAEAVDFDETDPGELAVDAASQPASTTRDDVQITLTALGYEPLEINRALRAVGRQGLAPELGADDWLRESLRWLSQQVA